MELNDLKTEWEKSSVVLESNLIMDLGTIKKRNLTKSQNEMNKPLFHEIANIIVVSITVLAAFVGSLIYVNEIKYSIPGFISVTVGCIYVYFGMKKAYGISKIDYFNQSIIEIQKEISNLSLLIFKFRKLEILMFPIFIISILPITFIAIQNRDLYNEIYFFLFEIAFIIGLGYIGIFWINKNLYDKKIKRVNLFLQELIEERDRSVANKL